MPMRFTEPITKTNIEVGLRGTVAPSSSSPPIKTNYEDGGDADGGNGCQAMIIKTIINFFYNSENKLYCVH